MSFPCPLDAAALRQVGLRSLWKEWEGEKQWAEGGRWRHLMCLQPGSLPWEGCLLTQPHWHVNIGWQNDDNSNCWCLKATGSTWVKQSRGTAFSSPFRQHFCQFTVNSVIFLTGVWKAGRMGLRVILLYSLDLTSVGQKQYIIFLVPPFSLFPNWGLIALGPYHQAFVRLILISSSSFLYFWHQHFGYSH